MKSSLKKHVNTVFGVLVGNAILAFTVVAFIVPHGVIMGGATGIGLTIAHYVPVDLSIIIFIVNSILFVLGATVLGKKFAVATIASTFIYPTFLSIVQKIPGIDGLTDNLMLATLYAGALLGVGIGLIVRVGSSTGGTDIVGNSRRCVSVQHICLLPAPYKLRVLRCLCFRSCVRWLFLWHC